VTARIVLVLAVVAAAAGLVGGVTWAYEAWRGAIATKNHQAGDAAGAARVQQLWDTDRAQAQAAALQAAQARAKETLRRLEAHQESQRA